ncbi:hypothetical protein F1188_00980 [Roseospira marina]|uniref:Uncharacterized protein n=2 Tax=Roseospira marina TaxID=140057 RepID=A0A5M6IGD4_9PROT|nr:hypothetical protein [Roseospira marina]KAA5607370.1 hypothetical protein F1188_00980 [Roseospira marina]MBB4312461.1 hypothetical protein [Roseospira marina]MBB5085523.1 hypothetical protein [Roseospira marina]
MLRSNRLTMETSIGDKRSVVVVRGHNIAGTLRMAAIVAERFLRDPGLFEPGHAYPPDWNDLWSRKTSPYDKHFNQNNWASLHVGGETVFATRDSDALQGIERLAEGADLDEKTLRAATRGLFGTVSPDDVVVQHESQTAVVVTPFEDYLRTAVLERHSGRTGSFSFQVRRATDHPARPHSVMTFCADVIESCNLRQFLERAPDGSDRTLTPASARAIQSQIDGARKRRQELIQYIEGFEHANRVQYRPERPDV